MASKIYIAFYIPFLSSSSFLTTLSLAIAAEITSKNMVNVDQCFQNSPGNIADLTEFLNCYREDFTSGMFFIIDLLYLHFIHH